MSDTPHDPLDPTPHADSWAETPAGTTPRVAFCQDCGKPLTAETLRAVGTGVFCEPCLTARITSQNTVPGYAPNPQTGYPANPFAGPAHPVLAGFLGLIPGVGAMYNGQYAKGFAHLIIFVLLDSISKNVNGVFGAFVFAWVCYQIFDAYHTAKARNDGLPLPNFLGLNDIGEKMGFGKLHSPAAQSTPPTGAPTPTPTTAWQTTPPASPASTTPGWVGYVPPTPFASDAPQPFEAAAASVRQPVPTAAFITPPHTETYTGAPATGPNANPYAVPPIASDWAAAQPLAPEAVTGHRRVPVGALWLIGLGLLILLANLVPDWRLTERWWPPVLFAGLAILIFSRRIGSGAPIITILRAPIVLMVLAVLFALHAADVYINFGTFFAVLFIALGVLLLLERTVGARSMAAVEAPRASFVPPSSAPGAPLSDEHKGGL